MITAELKRIVDVIERFLRDRCTEEISTDLRRFRRELVGELSHRFRLRPGRPRSKHLDTAEQLKAQGYTFHEIAKRVEPLYSTWDPWRRQQYRRALAAGLRTRRNKRRKSATRTI